MKAAVIILALLTGCSQPLDISRRCLALGGKVSVCHQGVQNSNRIGVWQCCEVQRDD